MAFLAVSSLLSLSYQLSPVSRPCGTRASALTMEENRLNNYVLPGPMNLLGNQVMVKLRKVDDKIKKKPHLFKMVHSIFGTFCKNKWTST